MFKLINPDGGADNPDESAGRGWASLETIEQMLGVIRAGLGN